MKTLSPDDFLHNLQACLNRYPQISRWIVALSGGMDSLLLLEGMARLEQSKPIIALHVNHQLSVNAPHWEKHCQRVCSSLKIPIAVETVDVAAQGRGLEEAARAARHRVFHAHVQAGDGLLLAHHRDDQAETMLLRLMRGTGPRGLAAMTESRPLGAGVLVRPLLPYRRDILKAVADAWQLHWVEDESNADTQFDRNYLRHHIMPLLEARWPNFTAQWQQTADHCYDSASLEQDVANSDLCAADERQEKIGFSVDLDHLAELTSFRRGNLLRRWALERYSCELPMRILAQIERQCILGKNYGETAVDWNSVSIRPYQKRLYLLPQLCENALGSVHWDGNSPLEWGDWILSLENSSVTGFTWPADGVLVRPRYPGERSHPEGRQHSQTLKKLLQDAGVEPWLRTRLPMLESDDRLIAVADLWVEAGVVNPAADLYRLQVDWKHRH